MSLRRTIIALLACTPLAVASPGNAQTKLVIGMPTTPPNIVLMPLHVAKELGFFKQEGLDIEIIELEGGVKTYRAMVAESVDISSSPGPFSIVGRAKGAPNKLIARRLDISEKTVNAHLTSVFKQIGVTDRTQAALWAERHGFTAPES